MNTRLKKPNQQARQVSRSAGAADVGPREVSEADILNVIQRQRRNLQNRSSTSGGVSTTLEPLQVESTTLETLDDGTLRTLFSEVLSVQKETIGALNAAEARAVETETRASQTEANLQTAQTEIERLQAQVAEYAQLNTDLKADIESRDAVARAVSTLSDLRQRAESLAVGDQPKISAHELRELFGDEPISSLAQRLCQEGTLDSETGKIEFYLKMRSNGPTYPVQRQSDPPSGSTPIDPPADPPKPQPQQSKFQSVAAAAASEAMKANLAASATAS
jgi:chromosome segregation ATPase